MRYCVEFDKLNAMEIALISLRIFDGPNFHGKLRSKNLFTKFEMFGM